MRFDRWGIGLGLALLCSAGPARALESACTTDADCGSGLGCVEQSYVECVGGEGGEGGRGAEECTTVTYRACLPRSCTTNADCTGGTSCVAFSYVSCSGGGEPGTGTGGSPGGAGGEPDDPGTGGTPGGAGGSAGGAGGSVGGSGGEPLPPEECVTVTESWCVPPWLAPCQLDADCGPGFRCVEEEQCSYPPDVGGGGAGGSAGGTGGAGAAGGDAGGAGGDAGGGVGGSGGLPCEPTGVKYCELIVAPCATSADCSAGLYCETFEEWLCEDPAEPPPPPGEGGAGGTDDGGVGGRGGDPGTGGTAGGAPGGTGGGDPECYDQSTSLCVPPGFVDWMFAYGPGRGGVGDESGGVGGYGGAGAPTDADGSGAGADSEASGGGCQTAGGGLSLLALLGVALLVRRR